MRFLLLASFLLLGGCSGGRATHATLDAQAGPDAPMRVEHGGKSLTIPAGGRLRVTSSDLVQPSSPDTPARITIGPDGEATLDTGSSHGQSQALGQLGFLPWVGAGLIVLGLLGGLLAWRYKLLPLWAGPALAAVGGLFIVLPSIVEQYLWLVVLGLGALLVAGVVILARRLGLFQREREQLAKGFRQVIEGGQRFKDRNPDQRLPFVDAQQAAQDADTQRAVRSVKSASQSP